MLGKAHLRRRRIFNLAIGTALLFLPKVGKAQSYTVLHSFSGYPNDGKDPYGTLISSGNVLYGTTSSGGTDNAGTVFAFNISNDTSTTLYSFQDSDSYYTADGSQPEGALIESGSVLYGTTAFGPYQPGVTEGNGTAFSINLSNNHEILMHAFAGGNDGGNPGGALTLSGSTLYGVTGDGGGSDMGTIFSLNNNPSNEYASDNILHAFSGSTSDGDGPVGNLIQSGAMMYGMTQYGGTQNDGTVFSFNTSNNATAVVHSFYVSHSDGFDPVGSLLLSGSTLYGMTAAGGTGQDASGGGVIFSVNASTGVETVLHDFAGGANDGAGPVGSLIQSGQLLYGMTYGGGANNIGTIFSYNVATSAVKVLYSFNSSNGVTYPNPIQPNGDLLLVGSTLYGETSAGGTSGDGVIFSFSVSAPQTSGPNASSTAIVSNAFNSNGVAGVFSQSTSGTMTITSGVDTPGDLASRNNPYGADPIDFSLPADGSVVQIWALNYSGGEPTSPVALTFTFDPTGMSLLQEQDLQIYHDVDGQWTDLGGSVNLANDTITVTTDSFSPFALGEASVPEPTGVALVGCCCFTLLSRRGGKRARPPILGL